MEPQSLYGASVARKQKTRNAIVVNGAAGAVNSENIQDLSLRTSQPSVVKFDDRIMLQPKIAARAGCKSRSIFVDPDFRPGLVKTSLWGGNHIEFILNRM